jgi:hypothetical protein
MARRKGKSPAMPTHYIVLSTLENEHATCYDEAFHHPGTILDAAQLREESIPILVELGIIAPCLAADPPPVHPGGAGAGE